LYIILTLIASVKSICELNKNLITLLLFFNENEKRMTVMIFFIVNCAVAVLLLKYCPNINRNKKTVFLLKNPHKWVLIIISIRRNFVFFKKMLLYLKQ
jgi:hypothetical protein